MGKSLVQCWAAVGNYIRSPEAGCTYLFPAERGASRYHCQKAALHPPSKMFLLWLGFVPVLLCSPVMSTGALTFHMNSVIGILKDLEFHLNGTLNLAVRELFRELEYCNGKLWQQFLCPMASVPSDMSYLNEPQRTFLRHLVNHTVDASLIEHGVVLTPDGTTISLSPLLAGIAVGSKRRQETVLLGTPLVTDSSNNSRPEPQFTLDPLFATTIAMDLGMAFLLFQTNQSEAALGPNGCWDNISAPHTFTLMGPPSNITDAFINGAMDGLILGALVAEKYETTSSLSALLGGYYGRKGLIWRNRVTRSNFRRNNFAALVSEEKLRDQVRRSMELLRQLNEDSPLFEGITSEETGLLANQAVDEFMALYVECPAIIPRCMWGARPYRGTPAQLTLPLNSVYVHHTSTPSKPCQTFSACSADMRSMQRFHQDVRGWDDIGYSPVMSTGALTFHMNSVIGILKDLEFHLNGTLNLAVRELFRELEYCNGKLWQQFLCPMASVPSDMSYLNEPQRTFLRHLVNHTVDASLIEHGVVLTPDGTTISLSPLLAGIAVGSKRRQETVLLGTPLVTDSSNNSRPEPQFTLDPLFATTIAMDLGMAFLLFQTNQSEAALGPNGCWDNISAPHTFTLMGPPSNITDAFINGAMDGLVLGALVAEKYEAASSLSASWFAASQSLMSSVLLCNSFLFDSSSPECPAIIPRCMWGARPYRGTPAQLTLPLNSVYVHHTSTPSKPCQTFSVCAADMRSMQRFHQDVRGWDDIGYSFIVGSDGYLYQGRGWHWVGAHTLGYNSKGFGVSFIGDYMKTLPATFALELLKNNFLQCAVRGSRLQANYTIYGHRQMVLNTSCPGDRLFQEIETWKRFKVRCFMDKGAHSCV
nr:PREDICTED: N-acetylmuramoyl-L-alanine amidase [Anolis carolinensis]|eukprot:XP_016846275.1 PREDICTED: N-acetylmuramoyl-L-alanine amidase [Anolis carolinensis]